MQKGVKKPKHNGCKSKYPVKNMKWVDSLSRIKELATTNVTFRHGIHYIPASSIAEQYYCEQKVEMSYTVGDIETETKVEGRAIHDALLQMEKTTLEDLIRDIQTKDSCIASFPIFARFSDMILAGVPDAIVFMKGVPAFIIELKTTSGNVSRLWRHEKVQVGVYGLILDQIGFDCSKLKLVIIKQKRDGNLMDEGYRRRFLRETVLTLRGAVKPNFPRDIMRLHILDYNRGEIAEDVKWAMDYWLSKREPIPTRNASKCRSCEYALTCPMSLIKPKPDQSNLEIFYKETRQGHDTPNL
jgi:CRISPR/Cas system-associated exonuclease Cas4 (RecB family)